MIEGRRYQVRFSMPNRKALYEFVGVCLLGDPGDCLFSLRPLAGTTILHWTQIEYLRETDQPVSLPKRVRDAA